MESLSERLADLSQQTKRTEEVVSATEHRDRAAIEAQRDRIADAWSEAATKAKDQVDEDDASLRFRWSQLHERTKGHFAELKDRAESRRRDRDVRRAEHRASQAERDAAEAVDFAILVLIGAMGAVADAALARADADDLEASTP